MCVVLQNSFAANECMHASTTTVFLEDLCCVSTVCVARIVVAGTSKSGALSFERRLSKLEGGRDAVPRYIALARTLHTHQSTEAPNEIR